MEEAAGARLPQRITATRLGSACGDLIHEGHFGVQSAVLAQFTDMWLNKIGADNNRVDITKMQKPEYLTYLGRLSTYKDINDNSSIELGASCALTPKENIADNTGIILTDSDTGRLLGGIDLTYRYQPDNGGLNKGLLWGTELFYNSERRVMTDNTTTSRVDAYAGYSYVQMKMGPVWRGGVMADLAQNLDNKSLLTQTYSAFITHDVSEFQRLRAVGLEVLAEARRLVAQLLPVRA